MAGEASSLYARNIAAFIDLLVDDERGLHLDRDDEVVAGALVTHARRGHRPTHRRTARREGRLMGPLLISLYLFVLAAFLGFELINKVPPTLHTPLMSGANAMSGITVVGALTLVGVAALTTSVVLGVLAPDPGHDQRRRRVPGHRPDAVDLRGTQVNDVTALLALASIALFVFGLKRLSRVRTARSGNALMAAGMLLAIVLTLIEMGLVDYRWIAARAAGRCRDRLRDRRPRAGDPDARDRGPLQRLRWRLVGAGRDLAVLGGRSSRRRGTGPRPRRSGRRRPPRWCCRC